MKCIIPCLFIFIAQFTSAQHSMSLNHYSSTNGLSNNAVRYIYQDQKGFIWIGTEDGLNKYDGYRFIVHEFNEDNSQSLSNNRVSAIAEDLEGNIWVGTYNGLNRLDPYTGKFQRYYHDSLNINSLNHNRISALLVDSENNLWIGTYLGLQKYNTKSKTFTDYSSEMTSQDNRIDREVTSIVEDGTGNLWLGVWWGGLKKFDKKTSRFIDFYADPAKPYGLRNNNVLTICRDNAGNLWIGNYAGGISKLSPATGEFMPLKNPENNVTIWNICPDNKGRIWYTRTGIGIIDTPSDIFRLLDYSNNEPEGISSGYHYAVFCDRTGILWLGSSEGLSVYNQYNKKFAPYLRLVDRQQRYYVTSFYKEPGQPFLWLGTFRNGLIRFNEKTGQYVQFFSGNGTDQTFPENYITHVFGDKKNQIWVGTDNGIAVLDKRTGSIKKVLYRSPNKPDLNNSVRGNNGFLFLYNDSLRIYDIMRDKEYAFPGVGPLSLPSRAISDVLTENDSILWIGTTEGLAKFNLQTLKIELFTNKSSRSNSVSGENISSIFRDSRGNIWAGTQNGLNAYDRRNNCFVRVKDDFKNQSINGITEDSHGNLWLLTEKGISKYNPLTGLIRNYDEKDGLKTDNALYCDYDGMFYCNRSREGYFVFHPDSIKDNLQKPIAYISRLLLFNKEVPVSSANKETPLKTELIKAREIILKYNQTVVSLEFTAINYTLPEKNQFAYKLEGFDHDWYTTDAMHRMATYTNLNPGTYTFRVKVANSDGIWSDKPVDLKIKILPPPWKTWWAYIIYTLAIASVLLFFRHNLLQKEKLKNKLKMDEMKMHFFGNISHEFRTPLTLIMAPLHAILQTAKYRNDSQTNEQAGMIQRNANRLADLINQLLDLQKLEAKSLRPEICQGNMLLFLKAIYDKFIPISIQKNIQYQLLYSETAIKGWFDPDKTDKILTNLLSNAFKFTNNLVKLELKVADNHLMISVEDNGKGIPPEHRHRIFDRFYHVDDSPEKIQEGTGIGLSLVKEMTDLLNGKIEVISEEGKFTCFRVQLPLDRESFSDYTLCNEPSLNKESNFPVNTETLLASPLFPVASENDPLILMVEDHDDLRKYLQMALSSKYRTIEAKDGIEGLRMAKEFIPDLIVSDVIMPGMDGIQMVQMLKNDIQTNHIPIILLTSLTSTDNKIKGFETGADDYITKPFNQDILLLRIDNLIKQRKLLQRFYATKYRLPGISDIQPKEPEIDNANEIFLAKSVAVMEKYMDNPAFTNETFASDLGVSVAVLYRKMNALMNCTPADFVRDLRIKRAVQLLSTGKLPVSEVGNRIGFDDPHYFGKWFKKNYGKSPSEVMP